MADVAVRSALFVDFDNIFSGLQRLDDEAARQFASDPGGWLAVLESGALSGDGRPRRFLRRSCYLNPSRYAEHRAAFTHAGFRVIDCPSLTQLGKSSADINLALDCVDALASEARHDEFILLSADADFTPLVHRLRAADRRVGVGIASPASAAYRSAADFVFTIDGLLRAATRPAAPYEPLVDLPLRHALGDSAAVDAVRARLRAAEGPLAGSAVAATALAADPGLITGKWDGAGSFRQWLTQRCPEAEVGGHPPYVWERARFGIGDLPVSTPPTMDLVDQVVTVTDVPRLSREQYGAVLTALAAETGPTFQRMEASKRVHDACQPIGVGRGSVNFIIGGLLYSGLDLKQHQDAATVAETWSGNVLGLAAGAGLVLDSRTRSRLRDWAGGGLQQVAVG